jgi:DmsE family decaheme c-type cytochrome
MTARLAAMVRILLLLTFPIAASLAQEPSQAAAEPAPSPYAKSESCQLCHEDIHKSFQKNRHWALETNQSRPWQERSCESCHGAGAKHAESADAADIVQPAKLTIAKADQLCLSCHRNQPTHAGRIDGGHARNLVSCVQCHAIHKEPPAEWKGLNRNARLTAQCTSCHINVLASFQKPHAHPLAKTAGAANQGMSCLDCHNPHSTQSKARLRLASANEPGCFRCHSEKAGPFTFEHSPVRQEGCAACHEPHGSANPRMLTRHEVRFTCLECHSNIATQSSGLPAGGTLGGIPPAIHDLRSPRFTNCTSCHMKIHGSHVNRALLR